MITIAICLIYYGVAVWLYQVHLWVSSGHWVPISVMVAWRAGFGVPAADHSFLGAVSRWLLDWPLSLAFLMLGISMLGAALGIRWMRTRHSRQMRQKWIAEQCAQAGYKPWTVPKILADIETEAAMDKADDARHAGLRSNTERYWRRS